MSFAVLRSNSRGVKGTKQNKSFCALFCYYSCFELSSDLPLLHLLRLFFVRISYSLLHLFSSSSMLSYLSLLHLLHLFFVRFLGGTLVWISYILLLLFLFFPPFSLSDSLPLQHLYNFSLLDISMNTLVWIYYSLLHLSSCQIYLAYIFYILFSLDVSVNTSVWISHSSSPLLLSTTFHLVRFTPPTSFTTLFDRCLLEHIDVEWLKHKPSQAQRPVTQREADSDQHKLDLLPLTPRGVTHPHASSSPPAPPRRLHRRPKTVLESSESLRPIKP